MFRRNRRASVTTAGHVVPLPPGSRRELEDLARRQVLIAGDDRADEWRAIARVLADAARVAGRDVPLPARPEDQILLGLRLLDRMRLGALVHMRPTDALRAGIEILVYAEALTPATA